MEFRKEAEIGFVMDKDLIIQVQATQIKRQLAQIEWFQEKFNEQQFLLNEQHSLLKEQQSFNEKLLL